MTGLPTQGFSGQPPAGPGQPPGGSRLIAILAGVAVVVILLVGITASLIIIDRANGSTDSAGGPVSTVTVPRESAPESNAQTPAPQAVAASNYPSFQTARGEVV